MRVNRTGVRARDGVAAMLCVMLAGGAAHAAPMLQIAKGQDQTDFGRVTTGFSAVAVDVGMRVPPGSDPVTITAITSDNAAFIVDETATQRHLDVGQITTFAIRFHPSTRGAQGATIRISAQGASSAVASVSARGEAIDPDIRIVPAGGAPVESRFDFGSVTVHESSPPRELRIENHGPLPATLASVTVDTDQFLSISLAEMQLPPGGAAGVWIQFIPTRPGPSTGRLAVTLEGLPSPSATLLLSGIGLGGDEGCAVGNRGRQSGAPAAMAAALLLLVVVRRRRRPLKVPGAR